MSNLPPQNDRELADLQASLAATSLSPDPARRDKLLYECGRAAGRAEREQSLRVFGGIAALLMLAAGALGFFASRAFRESPAEPIAHEPIAAPAEVAVDPPLVVRDDILRASTPVDRLSRHLSPAQVENEWKPVSLEPVLSVGGRTWLESL